MEAVAEKLIKRCWAPIPLYSLNRTQGAHWSSKKKSWRQVREWENWFRCTEGFGMTIRRQTDMRRKLVVHRLYGRKTLLRRSVKKFDRTNLHGAVKPVEDALTSLGWIHDDDEKYLDTVVRNQHVDEAPDWMRKAYFQKGATCVVELFETEERIHE